jgi:hypothetical protein
MNQRFISRLLGIALILIAFACNKNGAREKSSNDQIEYWLTTGDKSSLLKSVDGISFGDEPVQQLIIDVDTTQRFWIFSHRRKCLPDQSEIVDRTTG